MHFEYDMCQTIHPHEIWVCITPYILYPVKIDHIIHQCYGFTWDIIYVVLFLLYQYQFRKDLQFLFRLENSMYVDDNLHNFHSLLIFFDYIKPPLDF